MNYLAIDLGATSGRTILCSLNDGEMTMREINRFPNHIIEMHNHYYWDIYALYNEILNGLKIIAREGILIQSIGIDTWGVDFLFLGNDGEVLRNPYCYRDTHTTDILEKLFNVIPRERVYKLTGIQIMNFNSLYQFYALKIAHNSALENANKVLFIPDALSYLLTGETVTEYSIASTSQMLNPYTKQFEKELLDIVGLEEHQFGKLVFPGEKIGELNEQVQRITGLGAIPVIAVAGHDTASAVAAVPADTEEFAYLSSGTWSLMGIETKTPIINEESYNQNFTNEGGIEGTTRFLKNICGMWLLERSRGEWKSLGKDLSYTEIFNDALAAPSFRSFINPDDPCFENPNSMINAIQDYCKHTKQPIPISQGEIARCIFESLACRYRQVFNILQDLSPYTIKKLYIIGGGSKNNLLNEFTCNAIGLPVFAGPSECTAIGNMMIQAKANGLVDTIMDMRKIIAQSVELKYFEPQDKKIWDEAYLKYLAIYNQNTNK